MRTHAAAFLSDVEARPDSPEAGVAHRNAGATCWFAGEYREARDHFETALALFQPGRDEDLAFRFGADPGVGAMAYLTTALWPLGEVDRAISFIDRMQRRMVDLTHVGTLAYGRLHAALFELMRGDHARAAPHAFELARLAREHDLSLFRAYGAFLEGWENATSGAIGGGLEDVRRGVELLREQNVLLFDGLSKIALAEAEDRAGDPTAPSPSSTKRWRRATLQATAPSKRNCIGRTGKCCSSATPRTPRPRKTPSWPLSPWQSSKAREASNCAPRFR